MKKVLLAMLISTLGVVGTLGVALADPDGPHGQGATKETVCHETGSDENPSVTIEVSANGADAHGRHGDDSGACAPDGGDDDDGGDGDHEPSFHLFDIGTRSNDASTVATTLASTR